MKETKKITVCAMLAAFSVVLLAIGALFNVLDLSMAVIASLPVLFAHLEFRKSYPWLLWAVTSLLSLLLVTPKVAPLLYAVFFGFYPILKTALENLPRILEWVLKLCLCQLAFWAYFLLGTFVFMLPDTLMPTSVLFWIFNGGVMLVFVLYDIVLSRLVTFYAFKIRPRIAKFLK